MTENRTSTRLPTFDELHAMAPTLEELEAMTPEERKAALRRCAVTDPSQLPPGMWEREVRRMDELAARIRAEEQQHQAS